MAQTTDWCLPGSSGLDVFETVDLLLRPPAGASPSQLQSAPCLSHGGGKARLRLQQLLLVQERSQQNSTLFKLEQRSLWETERSVFTVSDLPTYHHLWIDKHKYKQSKKLLEEKHLQHCLKEMLEVQNVLSVFCFDSSSLIRPVPT